MGARKFENIQRQNLFMIYAYTYIAQLQKISSREINAINKRQPTSLEYLATQGQ